MYRHILSWWSCSKIRYVSIVEQKLSKRILPVRLSVRVCDPITPKESKPEGEILFMYYYQNCTYERIIFCSPPLRVIEHDNWKTKQVRKRNYPLWTFSVFYFQSSGNLFLKTLYIQIWIPVFILKARIWIFK